MHLFWFHTNLLLQMLPRRCRCFSVNSKLQHLRFRGVPVLHFAVYVSVTNVIAELPLETIVYCFSERWVQRTPNICSIMNEVLSMRCVVPEN
jgi:hypothetical protein